MVLPSFVTVADALEGVGLLWRPEIGDEVSERVKLGHVSILVDPQGMTPKELRSTYLWLPSIEQLIAQIEARQAILFHSGLELTATSLMYKSVVQRGPEQIETVADNLRTALGLGLKELMAKAVRTYYH